MEQEILNQARVLWDYHRLNKPLKKKDVLLVLGSHDLRVAEYAAKLFLEEYAPVLVVTGGLAHVGDLLETGWDRTEAEEFADVLVSGGVPREEIILEKQARNTGDNFSFSRKLLEEKGVIFESALVVTKPYMERRAFATGKMHWPDTDLLVTSPPIDFETYILHSLNPDAQIHIMVGDLNRIIEYPKQGYQVPQDIPEEVLQAYENLKRAGYIKHLIS